MGSLSLEAGLAGSKAVLVAREAGVTDDIVLIEAAEASGV